MKEIKFSVQMFQITRLEGFKGAMSIITYHLEFESSPSSNRPNPDI